MTTDTRWMTYAELAEALGIGADSARNLVRRKRWPRQAGNDGLARIGVPVEYITENSKPDTPDEPPTDAPFSGGMDGAVVIAALANHISRLESEIEALKQDAERKRLEGRAGELEGKVAALEQELSIGRIRAAQVEALNAVLEAERKRSADLQADRDRWVAQAERLSIAPAPETQRGWWPFRRRA
jgi:hypothetical protein